MNGGLHARTPERFARSQALRNQANLSIERDDFELAPFNREGGLGKVHQVFGAELNQIIDELNGALAA